MRFGGVLSFPWLWGSWWPSEGSVFPPGVGFAPCWHGVIPLGGCAWPGLCLARAVLGCCGLGSAAPLLPHAPNTRVFGHGAAAWGSLGGDGFFSCLACGAESSGGSLRLPEGGKRGHGAQQCGVWGNGSELRQGSLSLRSRQHFFIVRGVGCWWLLSAPRLVNRWSPH